MMSKRLDMVPKILVCYAFLVSLSVPLVQSQAVPPTSSVYTPTMEAAAVSAAAQYYSSSLSSCSPQLASNSQFLTELATCQNDAPGFLTLGPNANAINSAGSFPSTCPASCKQAFNTSGVTCAGQYLNLLATKFDQVSQAFANAGQIDLTSAEFVDAFVLAFKPVNLTIPASPISAAEKSLASQLYALQAKYYRTWASVCGVVVPSTSGSEGMGRSLSTVLLALVMVWVMLLS